MRALLIGLVGVLTVVGGAEAADGCKLTERVFTIDRAVIQPVGGIQKPDFVGMPARVLRSSGAGRWDAVEVVIGGQHYAIRFDTATHSTPAVTASSFGGSVGKGIDWRRHRHPTVIVGADILDGPLAGLTLGDGACD